MGKWRKRRPSPSLLFHTKRRRDFGIGSGSFNAPRLLFPMNHILSIKTTNAMGQAAGTFTIVLVAYMGDSGSIEPFYYKFIQPLDIVEISLDGETTTMMGIVDKTTKTIQVTGDKVNQTVTITGRSLGAIWEFDLIKYFRDTVVGISQDLLDKNRFLQFGEIALKFYEQPPYDVIMEIFDKMPAFDMELREGVLSDYLNVGSEIFARPDEKVFNFQVSGYSGSVWGMFQKYMQAPFYELWTESFDSQLFIRGRPNPFSLTDIVIAKNPEGSTRVISWNDLETWVDQMPRHEMPLSDILSETMSVDHSDAYSHYAVLPAEKFTLKGSEYTFFPPLIDSDLAKEIGVRDMQVRLNYIPLTAGGENQDTTIERHTYYRNQLYLWNRDNHRMEKGAMTVRGNANLRVGDKIYRSDVDRDYYILSVANNYEFGKPFTTSVNVSRGLNPEDRIKLYDAGDTFISNAQNLSGES